MLEVLLLPARPFKFYCCYAFLSEVLLLQTHAQRLAFHKLLVRDAVAVELFAAERHALDVELRRRCAVGLDGDVALRVELRIEMQRHLVEHRSGERV